MQDSINHRIVAKVWNTENSSDMPLNIVSVPRLDVSIDEHDRFYYVYMQKTVFPTEQRLAGPFESLQNAIRFAKTKISYYASARSSDSTYTSPYVTPADEPFSGSPVSIERNRRYS